MERPFLTFRIKGRLSELLGRESIQNPNVAILELVKNAWDADATEVHIKFDLGKNELLVEDNGSGMTFSDLQNCWFVVATDAKKKEPLSPKFNRPRLGEKGIARFGLEGLGGETTIITQPERSKEGYKIFIDWAKFTSAEDFDKVPIPYEQFQKRADDHGTKYIISHLVGSWTHERLLSLARDLQLILPPVAQPQRFKITLSCDQDPSIQEIEFENKWLRKALYRVEAKIESNGEILKRFYIGNERKPYAQQKERRPPPACGPVKFTFYYFPREVEIYANVSRASGGSVPGPDFTNDELREFLDRWHGIKIYRDGFRVKPYGDPGNDWLDLDARRIDRPSIRPENGCLIGWIEVSKSQNPNLKDTTTREGLLNNEAFSELKIFAVETIDFFAAVRSSIKSWELPVSPPPKRKVKRLKKVEKLPAKRPPLLSFGLRYADAYLSKLETEINECYQHELPNATLFLTRKLIEDLLYQILRLNFGEERADLWWDESQQRPWTLGRLIRNLHESKSEFKHDKEHLRKALELLGPFAKEVTKKIHYTAEYLESVDQLSELKIPELVTSLLSLREGLMKTGS